MLRVSSYTKRNLRNHNKFIGSKFLLDIYVVQTKNLSLHSKRLGVTLASSGMNEGDRIEWQGDCYFLITLKIHSKMIKQSAKSPLRVIAGCWRRGQIKRRHRDGADGPAQTVIVNFTGDYGSVVSDGTGNPSRMMI